MSYFGGAGNRRLEKKTNALSLRTLEQDAELGDMQVTATRRQLADDKERRRRQEIFGQLLAQAMKGGA